MRKEKKRKEEGAAFVKAKVIFQVICRTELLLPVEKIEGKRKSQREYSITFFFLVVDAVSFFQTSLDSGKQR